MPFQKFKISDDAYGRLWSSISTTTTTITLKSSQNLQDQNCIGTLVQYWLDGYPAKKEKVFVSLNNSNVLTVTRGYDGDTAQTFNEDDYIFFNVVSKIVEDIQDEVSRLETDKANLASPALTWNPTVPTQPQVDNSTKIANTEYVRTALANLIASSPAALDTLNELAAALGNDANFASTITTALAGKAQDSAVVKLTGGQTIAGYKVFSEGTVWLSHDVTNNAVHYYSNPTKWFWVGLRWDTSNAWAIADSVAFRFVVANDWNVGIGTTTPWEKLHVEWNIYAYDIRWNSGWVTNSGNEWLMNFWNWSAVSGWRRGYIWHNTTDFIIANHENWDIWFDTNNIRRATLTQDWDFDLFWDIIIGKSVKQISINRAVVHDMQVKNNANLWWVRFTTYVDADWVIVGNRKWNLYGYPLKHSDWSAGWYESFISVEFDTYDWNTTFTKKIVLNADKVESTYWIKVWNSSITDAGTMRWNGTKFQWYTWSAWVDFH